MRRKSLCLVLFLALVFNGGLTYGQGSLGAKPKRHARRTTISPEH
jgi:hypothetical protein